MFVMEKWDCPGGFDEENGHNCRSLSRCTNMFKCRMSPICLHFGNLCDTVLNCPYGDDEFLCSLYGFNCPLNCQCHMLSVKCTSASSFSLIGTLPYNFLLITNSARNFIITFLRLVVRAVLLILNHNTGWVRLIRIRLIRRST